MRFSLTVLLILFIAGYLLYQSGSIKVPPPVPVAVTPGASSNQVLGVRTKTSACIVQGALQDKDCTPGAVFPNVTKEQVCTPGYSKSVRNVSTSVKNQVYAEYSIASHEPGQYEVDHLISLELGGSNAIANLWPEAASPKPGFHEKDKVENYLHEQVCNGSMTLQEAQQKIAGNWLEVYKLIANP